MVDDQSPTASGKMISKLTEAGIECYKVALTSVSIVMPKITKVIVDSYAVMADGGILGFSGVFAVAMMAKEYSVPFLVVSPLYKLTPKYCFSQQTFNTLLNPSIIHKESNKPGDENLSIAVPKFDYLPPEYITLHITQKGDQTTAYIYRLFNEIYTKDEMNADF